jgi:DNA-binding NarL/FixJ family response regulator
VSTSAASTRHRVLVVDDHPIVRHGLASVIGAEPDLVVCGEADGEATALEAFAALVPDVVVTDLSLRGTTGLELIKSLKAAKPAVPVLVVSIHDETVHAERALRAGASGYVMKEEATTVIVSAIRRLLEGGMWVSDELSARMVRRYVRGDVLSSPVEGLSDREIEVFQMIGRGIATRDIALGLGISIKTVETHLAHIKDKLCLRNARELLQTATRWLEGRGDP